MDQSQLTTSLNLKAVVRETGLSPDVLRVWERRYGVPRPSRSPGRQRLYSEADVNLLKWLVARQGEGISISRAVALWRQQEERGLSIPVVAPPMAEARPVTLADVRRDWVEACLVFDRGAGESILTQAFALYTILVVCEEVLLGGLADIGARWYRGEITVHQEHYASEVALLQVERLIGAAPAPWREGRILVGCAAEEQHTFGSLLLNLLLRWRGWDTAFLGANLPTEWFGLTRKQVGPVLVVLAAERLPTAARLLEAGEVLRSLGLPLAYGGRVFDQTPSLRERIPGTFLGETLSAGAARIDEVVGRSPVEATATVPDEFTAASVMFAESTVQIEAGMRTELANVDNLVTQEMSCHLNLATNLAAALSLGSFEALRAEITWATGLLTRQGVSTAQVGAYLATYRQAVSSQMGDRGALPVAWLDHLIAEGGHDW